MSFERVRSVAGQPAFPAGRVNGVPAVHVRMRARDTSEPNRASSALEALYDLVFVVAVSSLVTQLVLRVEHGKRARRDRAVPPRLLRDLVGVDQLHLVRLRL